MKWFRTVAIEVYGLFVDDGSFALAILLWLGVARLVVPRLAAAGLQGALLAGGLLVILVASVLRAAGQVRR